MRLNAIFFGDCGSIDSSHLLIAHSWIGSHLLRREAILYQLWGPESDAAVGNGTRESVVTCNFEALQPRLPK